MRTTAERFDRRSARPATCSGGEVGVRSGVVVPSLVTTRPDEARVDEANEVTVVMASTSSGALLDVRWRKSRGLPNLRGFDSCSSRGAVNRASAPGVNPKQTRVMPGSLDAPDAPFVTFSPTPLCLQKARAPAHARSGTRGLRRAH